MIKLIGCKWVHKRKKGVDERIKTCKAKLVAKGYSQKPGFNHEKTFSIVVMLKSIRILLFNCNTSQLLDMENGC